MAKSTSTSATNLLFNNKTHTKTHMKFKFHAHCTDYLTLEVEAETLEAAQQIAEASDGGDWKRSETGDWVIDHDLTETE